MLQRWKHKETARVTTTENILSINKSDSYFVNEMFSPENNRNCEITEFSQIRKLDFSCPTLLNYDVELKKIFESENGTS